MNAKRELVEMLSGVAYIKCARIILYDATQTEFVLKLNYTPQEYEEFLESLNFDYDCMVKQLHGTVWLQDSTWLTRRTSDNFEYWIHNQQPSIPRECFKQFTTTLTK